MSCSFWWRRKSTGPRAKHFTDPQPLAVRSTRDNPTSSIIPPSMAGSDQSASWGPKSMTKSGKNHASVNAIANRNNCDPKIRERRHGRAGKHQFREWGDKHGELRPERVAPHKDAVTKFLSNEGSSSTQKTVFECDFEDKILQIEKETTEEFILRKKQSAYLHFDPTPIDYQVKAEVLIILTYASQLHFITVTVKDLRTVSINNHPVVKVLLYEGNRLIESKSTSTTSDSTCSCFTELRSERTVRQKEWKYLSESFLLQITPYLLTRCKILIEVYDKNEAESSNEAFVGCCAIGPTCFGNGFAHWFEMIRKSGTPVCMWHRISS